jgi:hypothetical protein
MITAVASESMSTKGRSSSGRGPWDAKMAGFELEVRYPGDRGERG